MSSVSKKIDLFSTIVVLVIVAILILITVSFRYPVLHLLPRDNASQVDSRVYSQSDSAAIRANFVVVTRNTFLDKGYDIGPYANICDTAYNPDTTCRTLLFRINYQSPAIFDRQLYKNGFYKYAWEYGFKKCIIVYKSSYGNTYSDTINLEYIFSFLDRVNRKREKQKTEIKNLLYIF